MASSVGFLALGSSLIADDTFVFGAFVIMCGVFLLIYSFYKPITE